MTADDYAEEARYLPDCCICGMTVYGPATLSDADHDGDPICTTSGLEQGCAEDMVGLVAA